MGLFDQFPYTNFHELNLDWILKALKELEHTIEQFVAINALKYADPILWDITSQYEKNTIVIDPQSGTAYISVQAVPAGVALTDTNYWSVVFDLEQFVTKANGNFTPRVEVQTTTTATFNTPKGNLVIWGGDLYEALVNITAGDQYVVNSNIKRVTVEDITGRLTDLITANKTNLVAAINENTTRLAAAVASIGDLNDLTTTDKTSIVNAINEIVVKVNEIGDLNDLTTTDKTSIVNAINELVARPIKDSTYVNVKDYGAVGDGVTDDTAAIEAAITAAGAFNNIYFPAGIYRTSGHTLTTSTGILGAGPQSKIIGIDNSKPIFTYENIDLAILQIRNIYLDRSTPAGSSDTNANGIVLDANCTGQGLLVENITFNNQYNSFSSNATIAGATIKDCLVIRSSGTGYYFNGIWYVYNCQAQNCNDGFLVSGALRRIAGFYFDGCTAYRCSGSGFMVDGTINGVYDVMCRGCIAASCRLGGFSFRGTGGNHTIADCYSEYTGYSDESKSDPNRIVEASAIYIRGHAGVIINNFYQFESAYSGIALADASDVKISDCIIRGNDFSGLHIDSCTRVDVNNVNANGLSLADYGIVTEINFGSNTEITFNNIDIRGCANTVYIRDAAAVLFKDCKGYTPAITTPALTSGDAITNNEMSDVQIVASGLTGLSVNGYDVPMPNGVASFILKKGQSCTPTHSGSAHWIWMPV